jgi:hypothetical protein
MATYLMERFGASVRNSCAVIMLSWVFYLYQSDARDNSLKKGQARSIKKTVFIK